jgi:hypothetical protein
MALLNNIQGVFKCDVDFEKEEKDRELKKMAEMELQKKNSKLGRTTTQQIGARASLL